MTKAQIDALIAESERLVAASKVTREQVAKAFGVTQPPAQPTTTTK